MCEDLTRTLKHGAERSGRHHLQLGYRRASPNSHAKVLCRTIWVLSRYVQNEIYPKLLAGCLANTFAHATGLHLLQSCPDRIALESTWNVGAVMEFICVRLAVERWNEMPTQTILRRMSGRTAQVAAAQFSAKQSVEFSAFRRGGARHAFSFDLAVGL